MEASTGRKPRGPTRRQLLFVQLYVRYGNASRAARQAGYSQKTAHSTGHENLQKPAIKALIDAALAAESVALPVVNCSSVNP